MKRLATTMAALAAVLSATGLAGPAAAQAPNPWDGAWHARFPDSRGATLEGRIVVEGSGGRWQIQFRSQNNPCFGREYPIVVKTATPGKLVFEVMRSDLITGCSNSTLTFTPVDDRTLEAPMSEGRKMTLTRE